MTLAARVRYTLSQVLLALLGTAQPGAVANVLVAGVKKSPNSSRFCSQTPQPIDSTSSTDAGGGAVRAQASDNHIAAGMVMGVAVTGGQHWGQQHRAGTGENTGLARHHKRGLARNRSDGESKSLAATLAFGDVRRGSLKVVRLPVGIPHQGRTLACTTGGHPTEESTRRSPVRWQ